jgi:hypothetical protein
VKYFHENEKIGRHKIKMDKIHEYYDLRNFYFDVYGKYVCDIPLEDLILNEFSPQVAVVDLDTLTKDMPYAHFDAETFIESNQRVIDFKNNISLALKQKNYELARKLSAQSIYIYYLLIQVFTHNY